MDHHRAVRGLGPEVVYAPGKTPEEVAGVVRALLARRGAPLLVTRARQEHLDVVKEVTPSASWYPRSGMIVLRSAPHTPGRRICVVCAGTSDLPVAEEAWVTCEAYGFEVDRLIDVGVAGAHRLLADAARVRSADVVIVVAGMEGALASVVGGLVSAPVIAVPTSVGYGASFGGLAALLGMLNACPAGVSVVNIDNGFGAAAVAARILGAGAGPPVTDP